MNNLSSKRKLQSSAGAIPSIWFGGYSDKKEFDYDTKRMKLYQVISSITDRMIKSLQPYETEAYCEVCGEVTTMKVSWGNCTVICELERLENSWTETLICTRCGLNDRMRAIFDFLRNVAKVNPKTAKIYMPEIRTASFTIMNKFYKHVTGSEFLGDTLVGGQYYDFQGQEIQHQDLTKLSFDDNVFDYVISQHIFEHIPNYKKALMECYRVLARGGMLIFNIPFFCNETKTQLCAYIDKTGEIIHLQKPEMHMNPVSKEGSLCYQKFSWDLLDDLRDAGFKDVKANMYWSVLKGHYSGNTPKFVFSAVK